MSKPTSRHDERARVLTFRRIRQDTRPNGKKSQPETTVREETMPTSRRTLLKTSAAAAAAFSLDWTRARAQAETVRIGVIYDLTGPFAAGGS
ncbi:MAG TPA: twin-arginine translocation signal domain-containing protein, partial [Bradyrhizobium sp.]|nr:twin-arginine translocation signal domain-containing protein [Bradyrhizobium sp.]